VIDMDGDPYPPMDRESQAATPKVAPCDRSSLVARAGPPHWRPSGHPSRVGMLVSARAPAGAALDCRLRTVLAQGNHCRLHLTRGSIRRTHFHLAERTG